MITTLRIKNMVCSRCKRVITEDLSSLDLRVIDVRIGEAVIEHDDALPLTRIREILIKDGFDLVEDRTSALVERVKELIVDLVQRDGLQSMNLKLSEYIEQETQRDYRYISTLFSQTAGCTIEKFLIAQKIERVKELLVYDEMSLTDIAFTLGYSSVAYLSNQFKQETGMPPSVFKKDAVQARKGIDSFG